MGEELKPNSHKYHEAQKNSAEERKVEKVVKGPIKTRKKPLGKKFLETFINDDLEDIKSYVFFDVIVPTVKDTVLEMVRMLLYGGEKASNKKEKPYSRVSYSSYYDRDERKAKARGTGKATKEFYDIILDSRAEAEEVLDSLRDIVDQYGQASLADYHDLCGVTGSYTDNRYGWTDLTHVSISYIRGQGYIVDLPKAILID